MANYKKKYKSPVSSNEEISEKEVIYGEQDSRLEPEAIEQVIITTTLSILNLEEFCKQSKIFGLNKKFLIKKYNREKHNILEWYEILIKEKINN